MTELVHAANAAFDRIYALDLVFRADCWKLCGDAHCCSFGRYKSKFTFLGNQAFQQLLLLPGEWEYLEQKELTAQFGEHEHKSYAFPVGERYLRADTLISRRPHCACDHDTRTTVCRLYPVLPVFDLEGRLVGTDRFGVFEELESIEGVAPACKIDGVPNEQLGMLLEIGAELGRLPLFLFYAAAYRLGKAHVCTRLAESKRLKPQVSVFGHFENAFFRQQLFDMHELGAQLETLRQTFSARHGSDFDAALDAMVVPAPEPRLARPRRQLPKLGQAPA